MTSLIVHERLLAGLAIMLVVVTTAIGLRAAMEDRDIDLDRSHLLVFEASRQLSDFDRLRFVANQVILDDPKLRPDAFQRAFALTTSRMRNFREGGPMTTEDARARGHIADLVAEHDAMIAIMSGPDCDMKCGATRLVPRILRAKRAIMKLQGRALAADGNMRGMMQDLHETAVRRIFIVAFLLVGVLIVLTTYMARKNAMLRQQAASLKESQHRIAEVSEYRARFLAGMSHEFRTPLNAIKGFSQMMLLMRDRLRESKITEYLSAIEKSAIDLEKLTDTVLDLAKIDAGATAIEETDIDLVALVCEVAEQFRVGYNLPVHRLTLDLPSAMMIRGDRSALKRCVQNLVSNALKFSPPETGVSVRLSLERDGAVALAVSDRGCGIPPGEVELVWGVYARSSYTRVSDDQGTGLGLPIVRAIVEAHGGVTGLVSEIGEGTTAILSLPGFRVLPAALTARAA